MPAIQGILGYRLAILDKDTDLVTKNLTLGPNGVFDGTGNAAKGAAGANISGLTIPTQEIFGNNFVQYIASGVAQPKVALNINDLPLDIKAAILGQETDGKGGFYNAEGSKIPNCALDIMTNDLEDNIIHISFFKGTFADGNIDAQTKNNSPKIQSDQITFSAIGNKDGKLYKVSSSKYEGFSEDTLYSELFPGVNGETPEIPNKVKIQVHYEDQNNQSIIGLTDTTIEGNNGDSYSISTPEIEGYTYTKTTVPLQGKLSTNQTALVTYTKN